MHPKVLTADSWALVRRLSRLNLTSDWTLAGGTGLALQLGHRISDDLDFFRSAPFDSTALAHALSSAGQVKVQSRAAGTLHVSIDGIRVSFRPAQAALLYPGVRYRGLLVADPRDIAVMKVIAIGGRGSRKDFVDLYFFLRSGPTLDDVLQLVRRRSANVDFNEQHLLRSLAYFEDAEAEPMPAMIRTVDWSEIKSKIVGEVRRLS